MKGKAGQYLRQVLRSHHYHLDRDCWKTNACACRPPGNKKPTEAQIAACRPNLLKTIKKFKPNVIILLGQTAVESVIPIVWKDESSISLTKWLGWNIPDQKFNSWICPTWHPSYLLRSNNDVLELLFRRHIRSALRHVERPFTVLPDLRAGLDLIARPRLAALAIREMIGKKPITYDFETNCIKPEEEGSEIVCCSVANGKRSIAYPWSGEAVEATAELLRSKTPKVGANIKFESRWTKNKLGFWPKAWIWDTMIAAHVLDNRSGITSVKFNAYVHFGTPDWDSHIKPYLDAPKGQKLNNIREVPIMNLLEYCAIDSREERKIYKKQTDQGIRRRNSRG